MKIAILIQSSNDPKYAACVDALRPTWPSVRVPGVETLFYYGRRDDRPRPPPGGQLRLGDELICDTPDVHYMSDGKLVEVRTPKFVMALEYLLREREVDYIYRCNCTCYVDQEKLQRYLLDQPREHFYAGPIGRFDDRVTFVSGCDMMLSRDVAEQIVQEQERLDPALIDDVAFGKLITEHYLPPEAIHAHHPLLIYSTLEESERVELEGSAAFHYKFNAVSMDALDRFHRRHLERQPRQGARLGDDAPAPGRGPAVGRGTTERQRVLCVGAPFRTEWSSNSTRKPQRFDWTGDPARATVDTVVYCDYAIKQGLEEARREGGGAKGRRIAWLCESPAIQEHFGIAPYLRANLDALLEAYEVILTSDLSMCALHPRVRYHPAAANLPWIPVEQYGLHPKSRLCSMFASHKRMTEGHALRGRWAERLKGRVDLFGGSAGSERIGGDAIHPDKSTGLLPYRFNIAMENGRIDTYYSEKLTDCFATGTVPVYWGPSGVADLFDPDGIIFMTETFDIAGLSEERYHAMLPAIRDNLEIVRTLEGTDDLLFTRYIV